MAYTPLAAGELRDIVSIEGPVRFKDSYGDTVEGWAPVFPKLYANFEAVSVREMVASAQTESKVVARVKVRYRTGITAQMRLLHRGKYYNIEGVLPDPVSGLEYLTLPCSHGTEQQ